MNYKIFLTSASLLALVACSDGDVAAPPPVSQTPPNNPPASAPSSASSTGAIDGFSSIVVNGVAHETTSSTVVAMNGQTEVVGDDSGLRLGMVVTIQSSVTNGVRTADRIEADTELRGPADNITPNADNPAIGTFTVVGQTVTVDENTVFDDDILNADGIDGVDIRDLDPAGLPGNQRLVVEVSGFPTENGVLATRIERLNEAPDEVGRGGVDGDELEIEGFVDSVADDGSSFTINGATFLVSNTVFEDGLGANQDLVDQFVEVEADFDDAGNLIAVSVELSDDINDIENDDDEFEIEGILQSVDTIGDPDVIVINGVTIPVDDASGLVNQVGNRVEIDGVFDANGVLIISEAEVEVENSVRTEDRIASVDTNAGSFTTRLGLVITPTNTARIEDDVAENGDRLTPSEFVSRLGNNDFIEARGFPDGDNTVWTRIEREDEEDLECSLRGPVDAGSISDPTFSIRGVTINTTGLDDSEFEDGNDVSIGRAAFFAQLTDGAVVEAESDETGTGCTTGELLTGVNGSVEFEIDDGVEGNGNGNDDDGDDNGGNAGNQTVGVARSVDPVANSFTIGGRTITVPPDTLIDDSLVERARGVELNAESFRFGDLPESLDELILDGDRLEVVVDANGNAVEIEDV